MIISLGYLLSSSTNTLLEDILIKLLLQLRIGESESMK